MARSSLDWRSNFRSPISSRNSVPPLGQLELADLLPHRAGERALLVAEQRALDQLAGDGGDVHRHERPVGRLGVAVDHPRHQLLAGAALAADQHGGRQGGHLVHLLEHFARGRARSADEIAVALFLLHLRRQRQHLPVEVLPFRGVGDDRAHRLGLGPLHQHVVGAELHGLHRQVDVGRVGEHDEFGQRIVLADDAQEVEAADSGQRRIRQHQVDAVAAEHGERGLGGAGAQHAGVALEDVRQPLPGRLIGINDQQRLPVRRHRATVWAQRRATRRGGMPGRRIVWRIAGSDR